MIKGFALGGHATVVPTSCLRRLFGYDTTAEAVQAELGKLEIGQSFVINGRVKGSLVFGNTTAIDCEFKNTRIVRER